MKPDYIQNFEKLGLGMFVHFGLYSIIGKGEWHYSQLDEAGKKQYFDPNYLADKFNPKKDWAVQLVKQAKRLGAKYITLTTKHHEGYFLYDSEGLTDWDVMHYGPKRDLVKEFVDACNKEGIVPFLYHALLDWHHPEYETGDWSKYIDFLIKSVEILCKNYGPIGGLWFDGFWNKPERDWQFDRLYKTIRKYQPKAMIINNTGMSETGVVGHYEIDSVTFERGAPRVISSEDGKERAGEMCEVLCSHWGYTKNDIDYKPISALIKSVVTCRYCNCNMLLNLGPRGDGSLKPIDKEYMNYIGYWIKRNKNFIYNVKKADFEVEGAMILTDGKYHYAFVDNVDMSADVNVQLVSDAMHLCFNRRVKSATYLDNGEKVILDKGGKSFIVKPFYYGENLCSRVIRFKL